jgi:hypothetical protein
VPGLPTASPGGFQYQVGTIEAETLRSGNI